MDMPPPIKYDTFNPFVAARIPLNTSVLDVGCATGLLGCELRGNGSTARIVGIDGNAAAAEKAKPYYDAVIVCDLEKPDIAALGSDCFDVIVCADVLEHLRCPVALLHQLTPFLAPRGRFLVSVPNVAFIQTRLSLLFGRFHYQKGGGIMDHEHLRFYTRATLKQMLEEAGLSVLSLRGYNLVRRRYVFLKMLGRLSPCLFCIQFLAEAGRR
jgi:2-polyprenyl-3-methyl-5-hydroxy-6-metoxy-1,4-benzoquinol methylase